MMLAPAADAALASARFGSVGQVPYGDRLVPLPRSASYPRRSIRHMTRPPTCHHRPEPKDRGKQAFGSGLVEAAVGAS